MVGKRKSSAIDSRGPDHSEIWRASFIAMNIAPSLTGSVVICNFSRIRLAASSSDRHTSLSRPLPPRICRRVPRSDKIPEPHFAGRIAISKNSPLPLPSPPLYPFFIYTLTGVASTKWIYASYRVTRETTLLLDGPMQICLDAKNSSDTERSASRGRIEIIFWRESLSL